MTAKKLKEKYYVFDHDGVLVDGPYNTQEQAIKSVQNIIETDNDEEIYFIGMTYMYVKGVPPDLKNWDFEEEYI